MYVCVQIYLCMHVCTDIRTTDDAKVGVCTHCYTMLCCNCNMPLWACVQTLHAEPSSLAYELHAYDCTIMQ